jgi:hypothetical protein
LIAISPPSAFIAASLLPQADNPPADAHSSAIGPLVSVSNKSHAASRFATTAKKFLFFSPFFPTASSDWTTPPTQIPDSFLVQRL